MSQYLLTLWAVLETWLVKARGTCVTKLFNIYTSDRRNKSSTYPFIRTNTFALNVYTILA
jgi:hypothetical protein